MIRISVAALEHQELDLEGSEPASLLELEGDPMLRAEHPVRYRLHAKKVSGGVLVSGSVGTVVAGECGRCLAPVEQAVAAEDFTLFYEHPDAEELDITEDVRAELLLNLPVNLLCAPDCAGLCPVCGANRNTTRCGCELHADGEAPVPPPDGASPWDALDQLKH